MGCDVMIISRCVCACVLVLVMSSAAHGQRPGRLVSNIAASTQEPLYADAAVIPMPALDSADLFVSYRIAHSALSFLRASAAGGSAQQYATEVTIGIEIRDSIGIIRSRLRIRDTIVASTFEATTDRTAMHSGSARVAISAGTFRVVVEMVLPREGTKYSVTLPSIYYQPKSTAGVTPVAVGQERRDGELWHIDPVVMSRNIPFGIGMCTATCLVTDDAGVTYDYAIRQLPYGPKEIRWWVDAEFTGTVRSRRDVAIAGRVRQDQAAELTFRENAAASFGLVRIPLDVPQLVPGNYVLRFVRRGGSDTIEHRFQVLWQGMPQSLRSLSYAIESLVYICPQDQLDSLREGDDAQNRERLMLWWKRMDPTPASAFNERMAEYYTRVDQAAAAFSSVTEPDGVFSDRGKVYILFGRPTKIEKKLSRQGAATETWTYRSGVRKTYEFEVSDDGVYKLKQISDTR